MKKLLIATVIFIAFYNSANCQEIATTDSCGFLKNLKFKNGTDTIFVKAILLEMVKWPAPDNILNNLEKEGKLKEKDFGYAVGFIPDSCNKPYYIASKDTNEVALSLFKPEMSGSRVLLTCVVFNNYKMWDYPFFIVERIELE